MKLRRIDKWGVAVAVSLFAVLWVWRYLPLQRCELHGELLKRHRIEVLYGRLGNSSDSFSRARKHYFPHAALGVQYDPAMSCYRTEFVHSCMQCNNVYDQWLSQGDLRR